MIASDRPKAPFRNASRKNQPMAQAANVPFLIYTEGYSYEGDFNSVYRMNIRTGLLKKVAGSPIRKHR